MKPALRLRRSLAAASALAVGLTGAIAVAAPATAQYATEAYVAGVAECADETPGQWLATWTVSSWQPTSRFPNLYTITEVSVSPGGIDHPDFPIDEDLDITEEFVAEQWLPLDVESVQLTVSVRWNNQVTRTVEETVSRPDGCREDDGDDGGPGNGDDNGDGHEPGEVEVPVASVSQCDSLAVTVTNPSPHDQLAATFSSDEGTETLTIEAGQSATASFAAGSVVTLTIGDQTEEISWQDPGGCDGDEGGTGGEDELPITGTSATLVAGGAALLLALGTVLFFLARRRRLTFTA